MLGLVAEGPETQPGSGRGQELEQGAAGVGALQFYF